MESMGDVEAPCLEPNPNPSSSQSDAVGDVEKAIFSPRLYIQRYTAVLGYIIDFCKVSSVKKLLDVGCANCKFMCSARNIDSLTQLYGVDIDTELLKRRADNLKPRLRHWLDKKQHDMNVKVFAGSITDRDPVTLGTDVVTAIEVVEHLEEPVLEGFVSTVFDYIRPKLVIITTPNSEYNVLFPNFSGMRHWDHKFEWNREQFQQWCGTVSSKYSYDVRYDGVGDPPAESVSLGSCSQVAIFTLKDNKLCEQTTPSESATVYEEIYSIVYPGHNKTDSELLDQAIQYFIKTVSYGFRAEDCLDDPRYLRIPLDRLITHRDLKNLKGDMKDLIERLKRLGYVLSDDEKHVVLDMQEPESEEDDYEEDVNEAETSPQFTLPDEDDLDVNGQGQGCKVTENWASGVDDKAWAALAEPIENWNLS